MHKNPSGRVGRGDGLLELVLIIMSFRFGLYHADESLESTREDLLEDVE